MGYSPPKYTCNGSTQIHSRKTCKSLLKFLHDMDENVTHPLPCLKPLLTPSRMPKPRVRKTLFSKQKVFVLKNILPSFGKIYWKILRGKLLGNPPKQSWVYLRDELLDNSPKQLFGKSSLEIPFTTIFIFLSCHALTPIDLGWTGAYERHYAISKQYMPIYHSCIY